MTLLSVEKLSVYLGETTILKEISFTLEPGKILALTGESGSGKSMTALSLIQLLPDSSKTQGKIFFKGIDLTKIKENALCKVRGLDIAMVFQEPMTALNPLKTIGKQISESLVLHKKEGPSSARQKAQKILEKVGLPSSTVPMSRFPHELSGGQRQRVVIAIAVALAPSLLIADEPTTALDVTTQAQILNLLRKLSKENNMAMILITHDLAVVAEMADKIAIMKDGKIVEMAPTETLFSQMRHPYTQKLFKASQHQVREPSALPKTTKLLEVKNVRRTYLHPRVSPFASAKYFTAVSNVSFSINNGDKIGLVGESGCGKSTLARMILGLDPVEKGEILLNGLNVRNTKADLRRNIQIVFQDPYGSFNPRHNIARLIREPYHLLSNRPSLKEINESIELILREVGLNGSDKTKYIHEFSGGQRQRIAIARALITKPEFVIFDEAVSALDVTVRAQILDLISQLAEEYGLSYLFISHDLYVVRSITKKCLVMKNGKIIESGLTAEILDNPKNEYTKNLINAAPKPLNFNKGIVPYA